MRKMKIKEEKKVKFNKKNKKKQDSIKGGIIRDP